MLNLFSFINSLPQVDVIFFIICGALIAVAIGVYFLIPVLNKKQYKEQRDNLRKREEAFKSNLSVSKPHATAEQPAEVKTEQDND